MQLLVLLSYTLESIILLPCFFSEVFQVFLEGFGVARISTLVLLDLVSVNPQLAVFFLQVLDLELGILNLSSQSLYLLVLLLIRHLNFFLLSTLKLADHLFHLLQFSSHLVVPCLQLSY